MQIKNMRYQYTTTRTVKIKLNSNIECWQNMEFLKFSYCAVGETINNHLDKNGYQERVRRRKYSKAM